MYNEFESDDEERDTKKMRNKQQSFLLDELMDSVKNKKSLYEYEFKGDKKKLILNIPTM